jgi:hypothetical protein
LTNDTTPTMAGFDWSETVDHVDEEGSDGWCVRDAYCRLFGWEHYSENWSLFIKWPQGKDTPRLAEHLGLTLFGIPENWNDLIRHSAHPGVALFIFPKLEKAHVAYVCDVRWLIRYWPAPDGHPNKQLALIDEREPPRAP